MSQLKVHHPAVVPASAPATSRLLPVLLLLFIGSGCAALIYEVVWLQMLQAHHRLDRLVARCTARDVHGGDVPRQSVISAVGIPTLPSVGRLRRAGTWHRGHRASHPVRPAIPRRGLLDLRPRHHTELRDALRPQRRLLVATDFADGGDTAGHCAVGRNDAGRRFVARFLLRGQHCRSGVRLPPRRFLPAPRP